MAALLAACGPTPIAPGHDAGFVDPPDASMPREAPPPTCELTQAPLAERVEAHTVLVTPSSLFIGDLQGLWRSSSIGERFERVASLSPEPVVVVTLVRADDGAIFAALGDGRIMMSRDEGDHWEALAGLPPMGGNPDQRLRTDGERIVGTVMGSASVEALYELDRATGDWIEIVASEPLEGWGHSGFVLVGIDRGALLATPSGYRNRGLFRLQRGAAQWALVEGATENGYTTFARHGDVAVVASPRGIWAEIDGTYRPVLEQELVHPLIVSTADGFFGLDARGVLRSTDGIDWEIEPFGDGSTGSALLVSENGGRVATLRRDEPAFAQLVSLSEDRGATWREPSIVSQRVERISTHGDGDDRISYVWPWSYYDSPRTWRRGEWASFSWPLPYGPSAVAMTETGAWACAYDACVHRSDDGEAGPTLAMPESPYVHAPTSAFATSHGLFVGPRSYGTPCGAVQPGLIVMRDPAEGTWEEASTGLRSWSPQCAGTPSIATVGSMLELDGVLWATQSEPYLDPTFQQVLLRSNDGGRSWSAVREGVELVALVRAEAGAFGLFRPGVIEALDAAGESFAPVPVQPGAVITDLVVLDGWLVAATRDDDGSAIWLSDDGAESWALLLTEARIGPIADLEARGSVLGIASQTSGLWEASGCFEP